MGKSYFVYIITNYTNTTLYTGVTNNLVRRVFEHKNKIIKGFSSKYNLNKLVYYEIYKDIESALTREKQLKNVSRNKKESLINSINSTWDDLYNNL